MSFDQDFFNEKLGPETAQKQMERQTFNFKVPSIGPAPKAHFNTQGPRDAKLLQPPLLQDPCLGNLDQPCVRPSGHAAVENLFKKKLQLLPAVLRPNLPEPPKVQN